MLTQARFIRVQLPQTTPAENSPPFFILMIDTRWRKKPREELMSSVSLTKSNVRTSNGHDGALDISMISWSKQWNQCRSENAPYSFLMFSHAMIFPHPPTLNTSSWFLRFNQQVGLSVIQLTELNVQPGHPVPPSLESPGYCPMSAECVHVPERSLIGWNEESLMYAHVMLVQTGLEWGIMSTPD